MPLPLPLLLHGIVRLVAQDFSHSARLAARRSFFHWNQDLSLGLLREWMAEHGSWWEEDLELCRAALLLASSHAGDGETAAVLPPAFDYGDGGRMVRDN